MYTAKIETKVYRSFNVTQSTTLLGYLDWPTGIELYNGYDIPEPEIISESVSVPEYEHFITGGSRNRNRDEGEARGEIASSGYEIGYYTKGMRYYISNGVQSHWIVERCDSEERSKTPDFGPVYDRNQNAARRGVITEIDLEECAQQDAQFVYRDKKFRLWLKKA